MEDVFAAVVRGGLRRCLAALTVAAFLAAFAAFDAPAHALDPRLRWQTVETAHFSVHFHQGLEEFARRSALYAEEAWRLLVPVMESAPKEKVQVVVADVTDSANGNATAYPRALIRLNPTPPDGHSELNDTEDWLWTLVVHELTHVLHMSDVRGLPWLVDSVLGRRWIPNSVQPNWIVEGFAVQSESRLSTGGRNRSALYDMQLRTMALEGAFPDLDDVSGSPAVWPRGVVPYLCGARFVDWVVKRNGEGTVAALSHDHASAILPVIRNLTQAKVVGKSWRLLFQEWRRDEEAKAGKFREDAERLGMTAAQVVTHSGERTGSPAFCRPSGAGTPERLCFVDAPGTRRPSVRSVALDGGGLEVHGELLGTGEMAVSPDGGTALVSQTVTFETDYSVADLYALDLSTGRRTRLSEGLRASQPAYFPDGEAIAFIRRNRGGTESLCVASLKDGRLDVEGMREVFATGQGETIGSPAVSPDGASIAFSLQTLTGRDIVLLRLDSGRLERLTDSRSIDLDPVFAPDGRSIAFASEEGGAYDLFRLDLSEGADGRRRRLTRLLSGALAPAISSDGRHLAFQTYGRGGWDVALLDMERLGDMVDSGAFDRNRGEPLEFVRAHARRRDIPFRWAASNPARKDDPAAGMVSMPERSGSARDENGGRDAVDGRDPAASEGAPLQKPETGSPSAMEATAYRPWKSVGAYTWMPEWDSDVDGNALGFSTFGEDSVGLHSWTLDGGMGIDSHQPYASASYVWRGIRPALGFGVGTYYGRGYWASGFPERQWSARATATWPLAGENYGASFTLGFSATLHQALGRYLAGGPSSKAPVHPESQLATQVHASAGWSNAWTPARGVSPSEGWSLSASAVVSTEKLGSDRDYATVSASVSRYLAMPWNDLHALALRLRCGIGWSEREGDALFALGGAKVRNPVTDYIDDIFTSNAAMRGYGGQAAQGDRFFMASAEYRMPLADVDFGLWTLPLYFRRLHGAVTADLGWAGFGGVDRDGLLPSVGAVLRLETLVAYDTLTQVQLGYAYGFGRDGIHNVYLGLGTGF